MFAEWPSPDVEMPVFVKHPALSGSFPAAIKLADASLSGNIQPLLDVATVNAILRGQREARATELDDLPFTARWAIDTPSVLVVSHREGGEVVHVHPDDSGRYRFTEDFGWLLTDDLPPLAEFIVRLARLRADRDGQDVFDDDDERHVAAERAVAALGTAAREAVELALVGLDDADKVRVHALLIDALTRSSSPAGGNARPDRSV